MVGIACAGFGIHLVGVLTVEAIRLAGDLVALAGLLGGAIAVPMWIHRAYRNLWALGAQDLDRSPGWAAGAWFVPVACLWVPLLAVREVWQWSSERTESVPEQVGWWWASLIVGNVLARLDAGLFQVLSNGALVLAGILLIGIMYDIAERQDLRAPTVTRP
jgi:hypothetical protein